MDAPILIPRTHANSVPPIGCLFQRGIRWQPSISWVGWFIQRDHDYSAALSRWPLKSHSGHLSHEKEARQWEPKAAAESASAANSGTLLFWRSGVSLGEKENDIKLEKNKGAKGSIVPSWGSILSLWPIILCLGTYLDLLQYYIKG